MLYNPDAYRPPVKADPFTLDGLIAWLEKQPPRTSYDFCRINDCLVAQYLKQAGVKSYALKSHEFASIFGSITIILDHPRTFGAALKRARAVAAR